MKPRIVIPPTTHNKKAAEKLAVQLTNILNMSQSGAWPQNCGATRILILNPGPNDYSTQVSSLITSFEAADADDTSVVQREPGTVSEIQLNIDFLNAGIVRRFAGMADKLTPRLSTFSRREEVAFHFLAHESHHVDEIERAASCGILANNRATSLAGAARPNFPEEWKSALRALTERYPIPQTLPESLKKAGDIANEASADLVGLLWMSESERFKANWLAFSNRLIKFRRKNYERSLNRENPSQEYDTADAIETILNSGIPNLQSIHQQTWEMAREIIQRANDIDPIIQQIFSYQNLPALSLPDSVNMPPFDRQAGPS